MVDHLDLLLLLPAVQSTLTAPSRAAAPTTPTTATASARVKKTKE